VGTVALFLPSARLVLFFFPVWQYLKKYVIMYRALEGINAVVVGFMWAATLYLFNSIKISSLNFDTILSLVVVIVTFLILRFTKTPAPAIVIAGVVLGWIL
jgi:chromate transporter